MASIRKRKGKWQAQVRRLGFAPEIRTFVTKVDAQEWARTIETKIDRRELEPDRRILDETTLRDVITRYRDEIVPAKKGGEVEVIVLNAFLRHSICRKRLSHLGAQDFASYRDERLRVVSAATLKRQLNPVRSALNIARKEWGLPLRTNPLSEFGLGAQDNKRERRLRKGELDRLVLAARKTRNPLIVPIVLFALETGMRRGEILAMQWDHINLEKRSVVILESKNGHSRTIPLTPRAIEILQGLNGRTGRVFPVAANALRLSWVRLMERASIEDLHFHDLRHEAISRFFEMGLTVPEVASISGHRDVRMLMRYAHADVSRLSARIAMAMQP
ncbi:integrase [Aminobacter sp. MSH1]|nr:integrase [Aminobacter sp. MSH1]